ncbi:uncharacterized protein RCH25_000276 [Pelodytes ibericus]
MLFLLSLLPHLLVLPLLLPFLLWLLQKSYFLPSRYHLQMFQVRHQQFTLGYWFT